MIKELILDNWKSFDSTKLFIDPLTFIIGMNASGKSNILDSFLFLSEITKGKNLDEVIQDVRGGNDWIIHKGKEECKLTVIVGEEEGDTTFRYSIQLRKISKGYEIMEEQLFRVTKNEKNLFTTYRENSGEVSIPVSFYTAKKGKQRRLNLNRTYSVLSQIDALPVLKDIKDAAKIVSENLKNIFILNPIPNHMRIYSMLSETLESDASNIAGVLAALDLEMKKKIEGQLTKYISPLPEKDINKIWAETVGRFERDAMLYCEEEWTADNKIEIDARGMSDGTLRFIAIILALLIGKKNSLLIIEEIDNGLHPSRAKELVNVLKTLGKERFIDILCTTHNPALIDALGNQMIPYISYVKRNIKTGASEIELLEDKQNLAKLMAGASIGDLMTEGKI